MSARSRSASWGRLICTGAASLVVALPMGGHHFSWQLPGVPPEKPGAVRLNMRSPKGWFMLMVAFVLTLNNFFYAVNPAMAKPIFDWLDPFAIIALVLVFVQRISGSVRKKPNGLGLWWRFWSERWLICTPTTTWRKWRAVGWRAGPCGWLWCRSRSRCSSMRAFCLCANPDRGLSSHGHEPQRAVTRAGRPA